MLIRLLIASLVLVLVGAERAVAKVTLDDGYTSTTLEHPAVASTHNGSSDTDGDTIVVSLSIVVKTISVKVISLYQTSFTRTVKTAHYPRAPPLTLS